MLINLQRLQLKTLTHLCSTCCMKGNNAHHTACGGGKLCPGSCIRRWGGRTCCAGKGGNTDQTACTHLLDCCPPVFPRDLAHTEMGMLWTLNAKAHRIQVQPPLLHYLHYFKQAS